jgi:phage terminase large subunit-like protein
MNRAELGYEALLKANVVFDEYHEFAQKENALYAAFIYSIFPQKLSLGKEK